MAKKVQRGLGRGLGALLGEDRGGSARLRPLRQAEQARAADEVRMLPDPSWWIPTGISRAAPLTRVR